MSYNGNLPFHKVVESSEYSSLPPYIAPLMPRVPLFGLTAHDTWYALLLSRNYVASQRAKEELECTFRPSLNPVTQSLGQAAPLDELVNNRRGQRIKERAQVKAR